MDVLVRENLHQLPADEVLQLLGTDAEKGLDILELQERQARFGPNLIPAASAGVIAVGDLEIKSGGPER